MAESPGQDTKLASKLSSWVNSSLRRHSTIDRTLHYLLDYPSGYHGTSADQVSWVLGREYSDEESFISDFQSRIWCTYRSNFPAISLTDPMMDNLNVGRLPAITPRSSLWTLRERSFNSDQGWGCMLRTSQSLLANALQILSLGREWRRTECSERSQYITLIRLLNLFMDSPSPLSPFSVHRMAVVGKSLGKELGEWFGPSTAALAIKHLVNNCSSSQDTHDTHDIPLAVSVAVDSVIYKSDVYAASGGTMGQWGTKPVLILIGVRLGLDGVHPRYYDTLKSFLRMQSCVGIAGGRPSSSYYFFGYQSDALFYIDPHIIKPAITTRQPPTDAELRSEIELMLRSNSMSSSTASSMETPDTPVETPVKGRHGQGQGHVHNNSFTHSSNKSTHSILSNLSTHSSPTATPTKNPKNGHRRRKTSMMLSGVTSKSRRRSSSSATLYKPIEEVTSLPTSSLDDSVKEAPHSTSSSSHHPSTSSHSIPHTIPESTPTPIPTVDQLRDKWYTDTYDSAAISSYFCDKPRKMNMNQMDPSMLLGFVVRDEVEFDAFVNEIKTLPQQIFAVADEPTSYKDDDSDNGIQSVSSSSDERCEGLEEDEDGSVSTRRSRSHSLSMDIGVRRSRSRSLRSLDSLDSDRSIKHPGFSQDEQDEQDEWVETSRKDSIDELVDRVNLSDEDSSSDCLVGR